MSVLVHDFILVHDFHQILWFSSICHLLRKFVMEEWLAVSSSLAADKPRPLLQNSLVWNGYNVPTSLDVNGLWDVGLMSLCLIMGSFGTRMARASSIDLMIISSRIISCPAMDSVLVVERARSWSAWSYSYSSLSFRIASSSMKSLKMV